MPTTVADIIKAETMMASAWPAFQVSLSGRWIMGTAQGLTGRANSLFFLDPNDDADFKKRLDWIETSFKRQGLPPRVRLTPLCPPKVAKEIQERGYLFQQPTSVLRFGGNKTFDPRTRPVVQEGLEIVDSPYCDDLWFETFLEGSPGYLGNEDNLKRILTASLDEIAFLLLKQNGLPIATAMVTFHIDIANIQNVMTLPESRRKGHASHLTQAALDWAISRGASWTWLAVENTNKAAIDLYRKLGYEDFYSYIYASRNDGET